MMEETFCIIVPTFNRAGFLPRTLNSLLDQTWDQWVCWIIDDGSTDDSPEVIRHYTDLDERFNSVLFPDNKGGVAANELGMRIACSTSAWWTRLGSDDTFLPHKLELDAQVLRTHDAVFGPYMIESIDGEPEKVLNRPSTSVHTRDKLRTPGNFAVSWANVAARTEILQAVRTQFGSYVDPRLRNMEDMLFNFRLSCITDWVWRGRIRGELVVGPGAEVCSEHISAEEIEYDATWTRNPVGATASTGQTQYDLELSCGIIAAEHHAIHWPECSAEIEDTTISRQGSASQVPDVLCELDARRLIGELLSTRATCNWNFTEHGDRLGKIWEFGKRTAGLPGLVAEFGVAGGGTTRLLSAMFPQKTTHAIDEDFKTITDIKLRAERFSLVHLDTETYSSIRAGLEFFIPRLVNGGMIFVNNYGWDQAPGVQQAVDEILPMWPGLCLDRTTLSQALLQFKHDPSQEILPPGSSSIEDPLREQLVHADQIK